ncbi:MAG TPA: response regulator transcription factor [Solirubrobacteraceae bacterium]|nr:response regulator transcription factor [Solirubrobacteraceae bacterium]
MNEAVTGSRRIRVLIVAGNDLFRSGLVSLLATEPDIEVVAEAPSGRSGAQLASRLRPDVALVSLRLSDLKGAEATRAILQRSPTTRVLAFIAPTNGHESPDSDEIERVIQAGASGFLASDTPIDEIVTAVRAAAADSHWLVPRTVEEVLAAMRRPDAAKQQHPGADRLPPRELELLRWISRGLDNEEIANRIGASPPRVKQLVSSILRKLGPPDR